MALIIPFEPSVTPYSFACPLGDATYLFDVRWNARADAWYFDLRELDQKPIALGVKIVLGAHLGRRSSHKLFSEGVFVAVDRSGQELDAGFDDIGTRVEVLYMANAEVRAAVARMRLDLAEGRRR